MKSNPIKHLKVPGTPVYGPYRILDALIDLDAGLYRFNLADHTGSIAASINMFTVKYDDPAEIEDSVLIVQGVVVSRDGKACVECSSLTEAPFALTGTIESIPRAVCHPNALEAFDQIIARVQSIDSMIIRRFIEASIGSARIYDRYFKVGASYRCHHQNQGGLANHVAEMIHEIDLSPALASIEGWRRDVTVACAIVHDLPKALPSIERTYDRDLAYHSLLASIKRPLMMLEAKWPEGGEMIRNILRGIPRAGDSQYLEAFSLWGADRISSVLDAQTDAFKTLPSPPKRGCESVVIEFTSGATRTYTRISPPPDL